MERRKIQLIGGTTYSISLPKTWIKKNKLDKQRELIVEEKGNGDLVIAVSAHTTGVLTDITLNLDDHAGDIEQVLFALNNLGVEKIKLLARREIGTEMRGRITTALEHISGAEIVHEDAQRLTIKMLLDKRKVDAKQVLSRLYLITEQSLVSLIRGAKQAEIEAYERESDRLYNLVTKMIHLSLLDSTILESSGLIHASVLPSYFLIAKKLENICDEICMISEHVKGRSITVSEQTALETVRSAIASIRRENAPEHDSKLIQQGKSKAASIKDTVTKNIIDLILRYLGDINEQRVVHTFYLKLVRDGQL